MKWPQTHQTPYLRVDPVKQRFQVNRRVFADAQVFELEKQRILKKSWLYLGHESEIAQANDYLTRQVLDADIIFSRDRDGVVRAFYNTCMHRGARVVRDSRGQRKSFSCAYHGWVFHNNGELQTQNAAYGYPEDFNASGDYNLRSIPRLEQRRGFWFINFDQNAVSLDDFLGAAGDRIDMMADHSADGLEVIEGCHEYTIRANYKLLCENSYDGYHLMPTHQSYFGYQKSMMRGLEPRLPGGSAISLDNGHATVETDVQAGRPIAQWLPIWGEEAKALIDERRAELDTRVGKARAHTIAETHRLMVIFPNTVMNDQQSIQIRSILPVSHDTMVTRAWLLGPRNEDPRLRRIRLQGALSFLGPGGFATPDEIEMLEQCQRGYATGGVEWNDLSKGFHAQENTPRDTAIWDNELHLRAFWTEYDRMMTVEA